MKSRFFIFVVFVTVVQNSFRTQTTTSAQLQSGTMTDYYTIETLKKVASLKLQKVVDIIFTDLTDLVNEACGYQNSSRDSSSSTNTSKTEVLAALLIQLDVTLLAIQITNPEIYFTISTAQQNGLLQVQIYVENIFKGMELVQGKNSTGNITEIENLENQTVTTALSSNTVIYDMIRYSQSNSLKIEASIQKAQIKSNVQLGIVATNIYAAIKTVMVTITNSTEAKCRRVLLTVNSARNQAYLAFKTANDINFSLIHKFLLGSFIMQSEIGIHSTVIQAIEIVEISDNKNAMNNTFNTTQPGSSEVTYENENEMMTDYTVIQQQEKLALHNSYKAVSLIYTTINVVLNDYTDGNQCVSENTFATIDIAEMKEYLAYKSSIDIYFNLTILAQPDAISTVTEIRNATYCFIMKALESVRSGIESVMKKNSTDIQEQIESIENATIFAANNVAKNIFIPMINARNYKTPIGIAIDSARTQAYFFIPKLVKSIFSAIKFLLVQVFPEYRLEGSDCFSSIEAAKNESLSVSVALVQIVFGAIRMLFWDGKRLPALYNHLESNLFNNSKCSH